MNKPIIIQGAVQSEIDYLLNILQINNKTDLNGYVFYECTYKNYPIIISKTKIGEISSAITTTLCIQKYDPLHTSLTPYEKFCYAMLQFAERCIGK